MDINVTTKDDQTQIKFGESLTIFQVKNIKDTLIARIQFDKPLALNLDQTEEIDTAGVQLLLALYKEAKENNQSFSITDGTETVYECLKLFNVTEPLSGEMAQ